MGTCYFVREHTYFSSIKFRKTFNNVYAKCIRGMARVDERRHSYVAHALIIL